MPDYYVSKAGDDSNDGLAWATAKKTIQGAFTTLGYNIAGTVHIGSGVYSEQVTHSMYSAYMGVVGYGRVVWDGGGDYCLYVSNTRQVLNPVFTNIEFRNATNAVQLSQIGYGMIRAQVSNCIGRNLIGGILQASANPQFYSGCLFDSCRLLTYYTTSGKTSFEQCTFYECDWIGTYKYVTLMRSCVFHADTNTGVIFPYCYEYSDFNCFHQVDADHMMHEYESLAAWQAAFAAVPSVANLNSFISADPLIDPANGIFHIPLTSNLMYRGAYGLRIGAFFPALALSPAVNAATWNAPADSTGLLQDGSDYWYLSGTSGAYRSAVLDLGALRTVRAIIPRITMGHTGQVADYATGDTDETLTFRWRASETSFVDGDGTPVWNEDLVDIDLDASYRYIQFEITLRTDGVY